MLVNYCVDKDKNVEIQQRCLEYYRLIKSETNITKNQFTTTQDEIDIDISLSFLDNYVNSMVKDTGKLYDRKKYDQEKLGIFDTQKEINYKPYQAPVTSIYKEASKEKEKYESRGFSFYPDAITETEQNCNDPLNSKVKYLECW